MNKTKVGVIGVGVIGRVHASIYKNMKDSVELCGIVESDMILRERAESEFGVPCYETYDQLIAKGVDAVSICTPDNMHFDFIMKSIDHGIKMLVEKPLDVTVARCEKILDALKDKKQLMVGHTLRFDPRLIHLKRLMDANAVGTVIAATINRSNTKSVGERVGKRTSVEWFLGIHDVDILQWLLNDTVVQAASHGVKVFSKYDDYFIAHMRFSRGTTATMENHWLLPDNRPYKLDAFIKIVGEKGVLEADLNTHYVSCMPDGGNLQCYDCFLSPPDEHGVPRGNMYRELECFIECVRENKVPPITAAQAASAVRAIALMEQSKIF